MPIRVDNNVKNQKTTPALYSDVYANIPAYGQTGRLFFATDTNTIYRDTGTAWVTFIANFTGTGYVTIGTGQTITGFKYFTGGVQFDTTAITFNSPTSFNNYTAQFNQAITLKNNSGFTSAAGYMSIEAQDSAQSLHLYNGSLNIDYYLKFGTAATNVTFPTGTYTVGTVTGTGTTNSIAKFTAAGAIGNSNITDSGTIIQLGVTAFTSDSLGIGSTPVGSAASLHLDKNITGGTAAYGVNSQGVIQSDVTANAYYYQSNARTQATAFTCASLQHYNASQTAFGAGSTVTNQYGFLASSSLTGAGTNYGFYSNLATSGTARWNFFAAGTAPNFMAGRLNVALTSSANSVTSQFNVYNGLAIQNNDFVGGSAGTYLRFVLGATSGNTNGQIQCLGNGGTAAANIIMQGAGGNVWIGTTGVPTFRLQLDTDSAAKPSTNTWTIASDSRVKTDITPYTKGLAEILQLNPVEYKYNGLAGFNPETGGIGIIAQDIQPILPETVNTYFAKLKENDKKDTELLNFNSHALTFVLINAIKELKTEIDLLKQN